MSNAIELLLGNLLAKMTGSLFSSLFFGFSALFCAPSFLASTAKKLMSPTISRLENSAMDLPAPLLPVLKVFINSNTK